MNRFSNVSEVFFLRFRVFTIAFLKILMFSVKSTLRGARRLTQRLNEGMLRCEIEAIGEVIRDSQVTNMTIDDASSEIANRTMSKARRMMGISRQRSVDKEKIRMYHPETAFTSSDSAENRMHEMSSLNSSQGRPVPDSLSGYESLRGAPKYQDLTHPEARRVQELFERKKMLARKIQWLKNNQIIDPVRTVNKEMKRKEREERHAEKGKRYLGVACDKDPVMQRRVKQLEFKMERDTQISRIRTELRKKKLETSAVMDMTTPNIGSVVTDPLKRHLQRRRKRVALLMQQYLDELFTCNSAQIILDHLRGASISVERVVAPSTRGIHDVYVRVSSDHPGSWVKKQLDILEPKIRSQIATRVNYGYTPEFKFHVLDDIDKFNKSRLLKLAGETRREIDLSLHVHFMKEMNWK